VTNLVIVCYIYCDCC